MSRIPDPRHLSDVLASVKSIKTNKLFFWILTRKSEKKFILREKGNEKEDYILFPHWKVYILPWDHIN
jgi:hypothetical protein